MSLHPLDAAVSALMREVGREVVMPHFRALGGDQIIEKSPGELVTVADRTAEERLHIGLTALLPEARVIGEEAVAADTSLLNGIGTGLAWIVDPIDGTHNYAEGNRPFAIMVALVANGVTQAGWVLDPATDRLCHAALGQGAFVNGERVRSRPTGAPLPQAALALRYMDDETRTRFAARIPCRLQEVDIPRCAGEQYARLALGENDVALYWRCLPWDHAPGALFLTEAGGRLARFDGTPYSVAQDANGMLAAATPELWDEAREILLG